MLLASLTKAVSLKAGKSQVVNFNVKSLPPTLPNGTYHVLAEVVEHSGATSATTAVQTVQVAAAFVQPVVSIRDVVPGNIASGKSASIQVTVANSGNVAAHGVDITLNPSSDGVTPLAGVILEAIASAATIQPSHRKTFRLHFKVTSTLAAASYFPYVTVSLGNVSTTAVGTSSFAVSDARNGWQYALGSRYLIFPSK